MGSITSERRQEIERGIAAYAHEREALLRLIRFKGGMHQDDFDRLLHGREFRKRVPLRGAGIEGDSFLLGIGANGFSVWATWLDLLQWLIVLGIVDAQCGADGKIVYSLLT